MADARAVVAPLLAALVPVPVVPQTGICAQCRSSATTGYDRCRPCTDAAWLDPPPVLPITMSVDGGVIHHHLAAYKRDRSPEVRSRTTARLAALLAIFLGTHGACVGEYDVAVCVPSANGVAMRPVVDLLAVLQGRVVDALATTAPKSRHLDPDRFTVPGAAAVAGRRVLLLDDTFASGASAFSAAHALTGAGATVSSLVVIGRHVNPRFTPSAEMLAWLDGRAWDEARCGRCGGERRPGAGLI